ncbi:hypothetical protein CEB3_c13680 [Peptococcaceae bacterium CEB3]|nr:hypothetical protein CEB3_c13680 [Peptococcaceae bacterium CEB3]
MANQTTVQKISSLQEAIQIANEIERYEAAVKQMKDMLKAFVEQNGPVDTGEKIWDFSESESWAFTPEKLKELCTEILLEGNNPWEFLDLGSRAIQKLNLTKQTLSQYGTAKTSKRFASRKSETAQKKTA